MKKEFRIVLVSTLAADMLPRIVANRFALSRGTDTDAQFVRTAHDWAEKIVSRVERMSGLARKARS